MEDISKLLEFSEADLEPFTPVLSQPIATIYILLIVATAILAFIVQRGIFRTFKKIGYRHIHVIICPILVSRNQQK